MDKAEFGLFICKLRKEKNMTQKELADKLLVSDKAVSKWERGISYPDITLLEPLSLILDVSVTELVQGRKTDMDEKEDNVEKMMQETLTIGNEQRSAMKRTMLKLRIVTVSAFVLLVALECILLFLLGVDMERASVHMWTVEGIAVFFGIYFWIFAKEKIPVYYDENKISFYTDGIVKMNIPGIHFNNSNWPHIINALRIWSGTVMIGYPAVTFILDKLPISELMFLPIILVVVFSLFIPIYYTGKKYE